MTFNTQALTGNRVLVTEGTGNKAKSTVLDGTQWAEIKAEQSFLDADATFNETVAAFFAPITEAAEAANKAIEVPTDELEFIVLNEGTEGVASTPAHVVQLTKDSQILRLLEDGNTKRLVWVGDTLDILAG